MYHDKDQTFHNQEPKVWSKWSQDQVQILRPESLMGTAVYTKHF